MTKKIFIYFISTCMAFVPVFAFANTETATTMYVSSSPSEEELVALITKLQRQLEEVRKNKVACVLADVDLSIGDGEGDGLRDHVKNLQGFLKEKGYLAAEPTGYFGKLTRTALITYQKSAGLNQNGELSSSVRDTIKNLKCRKGYSVKKIEEKNLSEANSTTKAVTPVTSITLISSGNVAKWATVGYSKNGFKVVYSKNPNPTYPTRDGDKYIYLSEPGANSTTLDAFNGSGTYYVRACEYLGGACGVYSNEITVTL